MELYMGVLHADYITKQYEHIEQKWTWHDKNAYWKTSTKIIVNHFRTGHTERGGVLRSAVDM